MVPHFVTAQSGSIRELGPQLLAADRPRINLSLVNSLFRHGDQVGFANGTGPQKLKEPVDTLLAQIARQDQGHGLDEKPFVVIKADNDTYGMDIMTARDDSELDSLNRRTHELDAMRALSLEACA